MSIDLKLDRMTNFIYNYMNSFDHLTEIKMTYCEHFIRAVGISFTLAVASCKNLCHAFYPDIWVNSASTTTMELYDTFFGVKELKNIDDDLP